MGSKFQAEDLEDYGAEVFVDMNAVNGPNFFCFLGVVQSHLSYFVKVLFSFLIVGVLVWPICFFCFWFYCYAQIRWIPPTVGI